MSRRRGALQSVETVLVRDLRLASAGVEKCVRANRNVKAKVERGTLDALLVVQLQGTVVGTVLGRNSQFLRVRVHVTRAGHAPERHMPSDIRPDQRAEAP